MKDAIIVCLLLVIALLALFHEGGTQAVIQDTSLVHADFPTCLTIHNGPIQRPDNYNTRLFSRKADRA